MAEAGSLEAMTTVCNAFVYGHASAFLLSALLAISIDIPMLPMCVTTFADYSHISTPLKPNRLQLRHRIFKPAGQEGITPKEPDTFMGSGLNL